MGINIKPWYNIGIITCPEFTDYRSAEIVIDKILEPLKEKYNFKIYFIYKESKIKKKEYPVGLLYARKNHLSYEGVLVDTKRYRQFGVHKAVEQVAIQCHMLILFKREYEINKVNYYNETVKRLDIPSAVAIKKGKRHAYIVMIDVDTGKIDIEVPKLPKTIEQQL